MAVDWKMGNLGTHPDGRTILLDWAFPGTGLARWDLCRYLALNRADSPEPKEAVISRFPGCAGRPRYRHRELVAQQLDLCMIGIMATFSWEKALGDAGELSWLRLAAHPVSYVLADHDAGEVDVRAWDGRHD